MLDLSTEVFFDLYIPNDSFLRDITFTNPLIEESQLEVGYYFSIKFCTSFWRFPIVSRRFDGSIIGIAPDNTRNRYVYQVSAVTVGYGTDAYGVGPVSLTRVLVYVTDNAFVSTGSRLIFW